MKHFRKILVQYLKNFLINKIYFISQEWKEKNSFPENANEYLICKIKLMFYNTAKTLLQFKIETGRDLLFNFKYVNFNKK